MTHTQNWEYNEESGSVWHNGHWVDEHVLPEIGGALIGQQAKTDTMLAAIRAALEWINRFGEHSPIVFGGESELAEKLQAAIAMAEGGPQ